MKLKLFGLTGRHSDRDTLSSSCPWNVVWSAGESVDRAARDATIQDRGECDRYDASR